MHELKSQALVVELRGRVRVPLASDSYSSADGQSLRADYLVGCDGGRGLIRNAAGIELPGWDATTSNLIAEVEIAREPE